MKIKKLLVVVALAVLLPCNFAGAVDMPQAPSTGAKDMMQILGTADADKDGKVSKEEFIAASKKEVEEEATKRFDKGDANKDGFLTQEELKNGEMKMKMEEADTDKDGKISKAEAIAYAKSRAEDNATKRFQKLDSNGDGFITKEDKPKHKGNK